MRFPRNTVLTICAPNIPEYCMVVLGALASGMIVSTINPTFTSEEVSQQLKNSASNIVVTIPSVLPTVQKAAGYSDVAKIVVVDNESSVSTRRECKLLSYQNLLMDSGSLFNPVRVNSREDIAFLPYSSATTGKPKGVMLTHHNIISNMLQLDHTDLHNLRNEGTTLLGVLPFFHIYGMVVTLLSSLHAGSKIISLPKFQPDLFLKAISKYRTDIVSIVPPLILFLAKHAMVDDYDLSCIKCINVGAAPLGAGLVDVVRQRLRCDIVRQAYGLTETSPITHIVPAPYSQMKPQSVGVPVTSFSARVVDPESGITLSADQPGEIWVKGPNIMKGYLNQPEANMECLTNDGWFRTGDIGYYDKDGWFYVTDRLKELIKVKGFQVAPAKLEALLQEHEKITDAAVIGIDHDEYGEVPRAYVMKNDPGLHENEVKDYVARRVAKHKHLAGGVKFVETIPKSAYGKILRRKLRSI